MIPKTAMVLATAIVLGSTLTVNAYIADVNTELPTEIYYGPVCEHARQGLPVREETLKKIRLRGPSFCQSSNVG